jgi:hypothetical protein
VGIAFVVLVASAKYPYYAALLRRHVKVDPAALAHALASAAAAAAAEAAAAAAKAEALAMAAERERAEAEKARVSAAAKEADAKRAAQASSSSRTAIRASGRGLTVCAIARSGTEDGRARVGAARALSLGGCQGAARRSTCVDVCRRFGPGSLL